MDNWSGFSDEDLRRLKQSPADNSRPSKDKGLPRDALRTGTVRPAQPRKPNPRSIPAKRIPDDSNQVLPPDQRLLISSVAAANPEETLSRDLSKASKECERATVNGESRKQRLESTGTGVNKPKDSNRHEGVPQKEGEQEKGEREEDLILDEQFILKHEIADFEKFRQHQKMVEEQNKRKKEMLTVAIQQRQKKAKAEATKLVVIKKELDRLDQMVNADVSVIRNKIEEISREFLEAQKRYDRAEREFVDAKLDLQKKSLQKEQLTEHLYTVIHQNEQRKAKKLSELMNKLEMEGVEDDLQEDDLHAHPVPICHISTPEPRKGCLQSLGLTLISPSPAAGTESKVEEASGNSTELLLSKDAALASNQSEVSPPQPGAVNKTQCAVTDCFVTSGSTDSAVSLTIAEPPSNQIETEINQISKPVASEKS